MRILLDAPRIHIPISDDELAKGPAAAAVTIICHMDFECPYCARLVSTLKQIEERHGQYLRFVFRDFPLPFHRNACPAAEAARCAAEQGSFWEMHDKLLANQKSLAAADLKRYAAELGLRQAAFDQCLDSGRHQAACRTSVTQGEAYGVASTPTLFVNGRVILGAIPFEALDDIVREELERAKAAPTAALR